MAMTIQGITLTYMQDFAALSYKDWHKVVDNMVLEQAYTLRDKRDNTDYKIAKLKDGKVWMTENLKIVGYTCTPEDTDITSGTFVIPNNQPADFETTDSDATANHAYADSTYGGYYTFACATAGSGNSLTTGGDIAPNSIAPKGWRLPTSGSNGEYKRLCDAYDATTGSVLTSEPLNFTYAGIVHYVNGSLYNQGSYGYYWSSTVNNANYACILLFYSSYVNPANNISRPYGYSVRGILREPEKPAPPAKLYGSRGTKATQLSKVYLPVDGKAKQINKIYGSVNGQTKLIFNHFTAPPLIEQLTYMQDVTICDFDILAASMELEKVYTLIDKRDGTPYKIALLKDGNIAMVEDLIIQNYKCTPEDTDIEDGTYQIPASSLESFRGCNAATEATYISEQNEGYYSIKTATAGTYVVGAESKGSILPKGWEMMSREYFKNLLNYYPEAADLTKSPVPGMLLNGYVNDSAAVANHSTRGYLWSSDGSSVFQVFDRNFINNSDVGVAIRGIVRKKEE